MNEKLIAAEPVSAYDAKTHLPQLLARTEQGDRFIITRHGKPVAQLIPIEQSQANDDLSLLIEIQKNRARLSRKGIQSIQNLVHDGHRY
jgi:prevent-host-death family protein